MLATCIVVGILALHRIVAEADTVCWWHVVVYSAFCAALYYTHYIGFFLIPGLFLDLIVASRLRWARLRWVLASMAMTGMLIAPWVPVMFHQRSQKLAQGEQLTQSYMDKSALTYGASQPGPESASNKTLGFAKAIAAAAGMFPSERVPVGLLLGCPILFTLTAMCFFAVKGDGCCRLALILAFSVIIGTILLKSHATRFFLPPLPAIFLGMATVLEVIYRKLSIPASIALGGLLVSIYAIGFARQVSIEHPRPWSSLVASLRQNYQPHDVIVFDALYCQPLFDYYANDVDLPRNETGFPLPVMKWWEEQRFKGWGGPIIKRNELDAFAKDLESSPSKRTIWVVTFEADYYDPQNALLKRLSLGTRTREINLGSGFRNDQLGTDSGSPRLFAISQVVE